MATTRQRRLMSCVVKELKGKALPRGQSRKARFERCVLKVKCEQKMKSPKSKKYTPWAICNAAVK